MKKRGWSCFLLGVLVTTTSVGCGIVNKPSETEPTPPLVETAVLLPDPTLTITSPPPATDTPLPSPAPSPTFNFATTWRTIANAVPGWQMAVPPDWVNATGRLETAAITTPFGLITLLATDSERTAASLIAAKPVVSGAFIVGLVVDPGATTATPAVALEQLLAQTETAVTPLTSITSTRFTNTTPTIPAASVDVTGHPVSFFAPSGSDLHTRIVYLIPPVAPPNRVQHMLFLYSAPSAHWETYAGEFARIATTFMPRAGTAVSASPNIQGTLASGATVNDHLQKGQEDVWVLFLDEPQYLSLSLQPQGDQLDLTAVVIAPDGQTITTLDNGYTNNSERLLDLFLPESGRYLIVISEFSKQAGSYQIDVRFDTAPTFDGHGGILLDETVQTQLPAGIRHFWTFQGTVGQNVSVVLKPLQHSLDAILNIYGPDGKRLAALDEGFSGDPEVVSGLLLPLTGEYTIVVSSFGNTSEPYALSLNQGGEQTANFYDAGDLVYGQTRRETLRANEAHAWFFQGQMGEQVQIQATPLSDNLDLIIWLVDPDINLLATADLFFAGETETLAYALPTDGQYLALVREFSGQAGSYEISLLDTATITPTYAGVLSYGTTVSGTIPAAQSIVWLFTGQDGDVVDILSQPANASDLVLSLQTPDGRTVLTIDAASADGAEQINSFRLTISGEWRILLQEFLGDVADYSLAVNKQ